MKAEIFNFHYNSLCLQNSGDVAYGFDLLYVWRLRSDVDRRNVS